MNYDFLKTIKDDTGLIYLGTVQVWASKHAAGTSDEAMLAMARLIFQVVDAAREDAETTAFAMWQTASQYRLAGSKN